MEPPPPALIVRCNCSHTAMHRQVSAGPLPWHNERVDVTPCPVCATVHYCSEACRQYDAPVHQYVCYPQAADRMRGYCRLILSDAACVLRATGPTLSSRTDVHAFWELSHRKELHYVAPLGGSCTTHICALCLAPVEVLYREYREWVHYDALPIAYGKCAQCWRKGRVLCGATFTDGSECVARRARFAAKAAVVARHWLDAQLGSVAELTRCVLQWLAALWSCCPWHRVEAPIVLRATQPSKKARRCALPHF